MCTSLTQYKNNRCFQKLDFQKKKKKRKKVAELVSNFWLKYLFIVIL